MSDIGFGILGSGNMATVYADDLATQVTGGRFVAVAGGTRAPAFGTEYGGDAEPTIEALLARADVDVVVIATPHSTHVSQAVAAAEEGILRGVLFDRLRAHGGLVPAIAVTTVTFALLHVPVYGWHVVPLDLAVGLGLAGLRLGTRTVAAPAVAHAVADLATWWL